MTSRKRHISLNSGVASALSISSHLEVHARGSVQLFKIQSSMTILK